MLERHFMVFYYSIHDAKKPAWKLKFPCLAWIGWEPYELEKFPLQHNTRLCNTYFLVLYTPGISVIPLRDKKRREFSASSLSH